MLKTVWMLLTKAPIDVYTSHNPPVLTLFDDLSSSSLSSLLAPKAPYLSLHGLGDNHHFRCSFHPKLLLETPWSCLLARTIHFDGGTYPSKPSWDTADPYFCKRLPARHLVSEDALLLCPVTLTCVHPKRTEYFLGKDFGRDRFMYQLFRQVCSNHTVNSGLENISVPFVLRDVES